MATCAGERFAPSSLNYNSVPQTTTNICYDPQKDDYTPLKAWNLHQPHSSIVNFFLLEAAAHPEGLTNRRTRSEELVGSLLLIPHRESQLSTHRYLLSWDRWWRRRICELVGWRSGLEWRLWRWGKMSRMPVFGLALNALVLNRFVLLDVDGENHNHWGRIIS